MTVGLPHQFNCFFGDIKKINKKNSKKKKSLKMTS